MVLLVDLLDFLLNYSPISIAVADSYVRRGVAVASSDPIRDFTMRGREGDTGFAVVIKEPKVEDVTADKLRVF